MRAAAFQGCSCGLECETSLVPVNQLPGCGETYDHRLPPVVLPNRSTAAHLAFARAEIGDVLPRVP
jgi:hypothetical protein